MHYLFILKHSPYQSSLAREALDFALASAAFDQQVSLLFMADGLLQLLPEQIGQVGKKNIQKTLASLSLFDINNVYFSNSCATQRGLTHGQLSLDASAVSNDDIQHLLKSADKVFSF